LEIFLLADNAWIVCLLNVREQRVLCELTMRDSRPFVDGVWSSDRRFAFPTGSIGSITVFQCGDRRASADSVDLFTSFEKGVFD
jgi:hypothetical protein